MRIVLDPAYVLHTRKYHETSVIAYFFTQNHGLVTSIARSARGPRSRYKGAIIPFSPLLVSLSGKSELLYLNGLETNGPPLFFEGDKLFSCIYLNEVLLKLLPSFDPFPNLFSLYQNTLKQLQMPSSCIQTTLRNFEKELLVELGYGLQLTHMNSGEEVKPQSFYRYCVDEGITVVTNYASHDFAFKGSHLLAIDQGNYEDPEVLHAARRLLRSAISSLLGDSKIKSRELFTT